jgi:elongation factor G
LADLAFGREAASLALKKRQERKMANAGNERTAPGPRAVAIVGPYLSGKTTLLESILHFTGKVNRKGVVTDGNTVGDSTPEARAHAMSVEANVATTDYLDESFTFIDCPGSIEFFQDTIDAISGVDAAIVVCEPDPDKAMMLQPTLKLLSDQDVPHLIFVNKIDTAAGDVTRLLEALQPASEHPLVLRQMPIWESEIATGFVDLALERAFVYREHAPSELIELTGDLNDQEKQARYEMLEKLADYNDQLMEELLEDIEPPADEVFDNLQSELADGLIVPVLLGSAEGDNGIRRLLKSLRHDVPGVKAAAVRAKLNGAADSGAVVKVLKTYHSGHGGKLSIARVLAGTLKDGETLYRNNGDDERVSGLFSIIGQSTEKRPNAGVGATVALGKLEGVKTGEFLTTAKGVAVDGDAHRTLAPVYGMAIRAQEAKDDVKLTTAITKICEEDPSIRIEHNADTNQMILWGQGEMHLRVAAEKIKSRAGLELQTEPPTVPYKEAIKKTITQRGRHKKQSGGHGQFGDVVLEIKPLPRGSGFVFDDKITGGVVPKNYIPSVEAGVKDYLQRGPLGFPVVDVSVTLVDGSHHTVDSSDMAFRAAGRLAMSEGMAACQPVLLEPIMNVQVTAPSAATAKVNAIISSRRGQILGFDSRPGWAGWDLVNAHLPQSELHNLIIELRSASHGIGTFTFEFDHLQELTGKLAEDVLQSTKAA